MLEVAPWLLVPAATTSWRCSATCRRDRPGQDRAEVLQQVRDLADAGRLSSAFLYDADNVLA